MRNFKSFEKIERSKWNEFVIPRDKDYCFSNIPNTIKNLYGIENDKGLPKDVFGNIKSNPNKVVFFLVDAFGFEFYERVLNSSKFLKLMEEKGVVSKITAQFPASTSGEITTALTNTKIYEHGIYEWFYYEPKTDSNITAFLFKETISDEFENIHSLGIKPEDFLPRESFFKELKEEGIKSIGYQPQFINGSTYTKYMFRDGEIKDYTTEENLLNGLVKDLKKDNSKEYYYVYYSDIDSIGHEFGEDSKEFNDALLKFIDFLDKFYEKVKDLRGVDIIISADHGQVVIDQSKGIYLEKEVCDIHKYLKRNSKGDIYSPCGYFRDLALHVKEDKLQELKSILKEKLKGRCEVFTLDELVELNIFSEMTDNLKNRCGNLMIIPLGNNAVWLDELIDQRGVHGGLSEKEMYIPFLYYSI